MQFSLDYFYGNEAGQFRFYRVPKALFDGDLSLEAATLYGLMLDRVGLSVKNGWLDSLGRVFIYFVQKDVQKFLRCGHNRATAFVRELERFGLIERKRQGLGKPAMIYVKNFFGCGNNVAPQNETNEAVDPSRNEEKVSAVQREESSNKALFSTPEEAVNTAQTGQSRVPAEGSLDCPNRAANETEEKETELTETNRILAVKNCASFRPAPPDIHSATFPPALPTANASLVCGGGPRRKGEPSSPLRPWAGLLERQIVVVGRHFPQIQDRFIQHFRCISGIIVTLAINQQTAFYVPCGYQQAAGHAVAAAAHQLPVCGDEGHVLQQVREKVLVLRLG